MSEINQELLEVLKEYLVQNIPDVEDILGSFYSIDVANTKVKLDENFEKRHRLTVTLILLEDYEKN